MVDSNTSHIERVKKRIARVQHIRERVKEEAGGFYRDKKGQYSPDGFRIDTGYMRPGRNGKPEPVYEWDRDIPYEKFKNKHTQEPVTSEQIDAVKYFVGETVNDSTKVFGYNYSEKVIDDMIRTRLFYSKDLSKQVEEYKREMSDKNYQNQQRQARFAAEVKEYKILTGKNYLG